MRFFQDYLSDKFSHRVYRVPLDLGFGCPRGASIEERCYFCDEDGARASHISLGMSIEEQVRRGVDFVRKRYGEDCGLAAYVQAHTGTNSNPAKLRELYTKLLRMAEFDCLIIATRPDALTGEIIQVLSELSKKIELWVELGVQTANDDTLKNINRGHDFASVVDAVRSLDAGGVNVAAHLIIGLPDEGLRDFRRTAEKISSLPFKAVKIHNLLVLRNTVFEAWYKDGRIRTMNEHEYAIALIDFIRRLPQDWLLMRVCADADKDKIIAPKWSMEKHQFIEMIRSMIDGADDSKFCEVRTADGSSTLWHPVYREHYRSLAGARSESRIKFLEACEIRKKLVSNNNLRILEVGLGIGCNLSETLKLLRETGNECFLDYVCIENDMSGLEKAISVGIVEDVDMPVMNGLVRDAFYVGDSFRVTLLKSEARIAVSNLTGFFDAVYLDPFSTDKNVELWTFDFIKKISEHMKNDCIIATYSSAYPVRGALLRAGMHLGESPPFGRKRGGTLASFDKTIISNPLNEREIRIISGSTAGLPYRDPLMSDTHEVIRDRRNRLVRRLRSRGVPKWASF